MAHLLFGVSLSAVTIRHRSLDRECSTSDVLLVFLSTTKLRY